MRNEWVGMAADKINDRVIPFDLLASPLQGTNLIEAGAGTGKTHTIAGLFLRLLLEKGFSVNDILVVTYTVAATEELKARIRRGLRDALEAFRTGTSPDEFLKGLMQKNPDRDRALRILQETLHDFDEAAIFTIHGFCQRVLHESAFESGSLFDTELVADQDRLKEEIARDFWRLHFYNAPLEFIAYAQSKGVNAKYFVDLLASGTAHIDARIVPEISSADLTCLDAFRRMAEKLRAAWPQARAEVLEIFGRSSLKHYGDPQKPVAGMDVWAANGAGLPLFKDFEKFTPAKLAAGTKKNCATPQHPFFDLCAEFQERAAPLAAEMDRKILFLKGEIFRYCRREMPARKERQNIQSFDDLLIRLRDALNKPSGDDLAKAVRIKYRAALIDEFQDTDPIQYAIFKSAFGDRESILFLIGDPRQAIYSFRGADLFAYMRAAEHVDCRYTLTKNWRSEPGLIAAVNTIFSARINPFIYEAIPFAAATAEKRRAEDTLKIDGKSEPPFQLWFVDAGRFAEAGKPVAKGQAREFIPDAVAGEISRLLGLAGQGTARIGGRPLQAGDIAVLVRKNNEARLIQRSLGALRIPSVLHGMGDLFQDTDEALEVSRVLAAVASPNQEHLVKIALATDLLGRNGEDLERLARHEAGWEDWVVKFREYNEMWERRGFIRMFRYFLWKEKVRTRLLSFPDGERRLTNVLHLAEILHQEARERKLGIAGLLKWLRQRRDPDAPRAEEHELRLENDADAVKIVTIHKSKGLEYAVVFCPFNWDASEIPKRGLFLFHDPKDDWRANLVLDPEKNSHRVYGEKELLAENLRLLYVSLTRAKNRCYLVWGRFNAAGTSAPAYLFHAPDGSPEDIVEATGATFEGLTDAEIRRAVTTISRHAGGAIQVSDIPLGGGEPQPTSSEVPKDLDFAPFGGRIMRDWQIASFSGFIGDQGRETEIPGGTEVELPDYDEKVDPEDAGLAEEPSGIFAFPRGARAGTLLHDIFREIDFTGKEPPRPGEVISAKLTEHGFDASWEETIADMVEKVLSVELGEDGPALRAIRKQDRLSELEFYFPLLTVTPEKLKVIFARHGGPEIAGDFPERIGNLKFSPARGFMKGFIDLVFQWKGRFYLADWKSNFLGARVEDYGREALSREMKERFYILQYHIYALALHRYLGTRLREYDYRKHFGGVFYIFLRGVDPARGPEFGIYRDTPPRELIQALEENLIGLR